MSKTRWISVWCLALALLLLAASYFPRPSGPNLGLPFGYYGKLNRIKEEISRLPGVEILSVDVHTDLRVEDFWITVRTDRGETVRLDFSNANIRSVDEMLTELDVIRPGG